MDSKPYYVLVVLGKASNYVKVSIGPELDLKSHGTEGNFPDDFFHILKNKLFRKNSIEISGWKRVLSGT